MKATNAKDAGTDGFPDKRMSSQGYVQDARVHTGTEQGRPDWNMSTRKGLYELGEVAIVFNCELSHLVVSSSDYE